MTLFIFIKYQQKKKKKRKYIYGTKALSDMCEITEIFLHFILAYATFLHPVVVAFAASVAVVAFVVAASATSSLQLWAKMSR